MDSLVLTHEHCSFCLSNCLVGRGIAQSLPNPCTIKIEINSHRKHRYPLYLMGGWFDHTGWATMQDSHHVDLNEIIAKALSNLDTPTLWQTIEDTPLVWTAPLSIGRAICGRDDGGNPSSSILLY